MKKGTAEKLLFNDFNAERLANLMNKILNDPKYAENTKARAKLFMDQKESPLDRAIWWIEWAIRNPNVNVFEHPGNKMNHFQRLSLDIYLFILLITFIFIKLLCLVVRRFINLMSSHNGKDSREKKRN